MTIRKSLVGSALAVLTALGVLTGCAEDTTNHDAGAAPHRDTSGASASPGEHNASDVTFLQQMIPHHAQAVEMTAMVEGRTTTESMVALAGRIEKAQGPEIEQMTGWLTAWDRPTTPPATGTDHSEHGSDGSHMPGMMSEDQMAGLDQATGAKFDQQWLSMMVDHHQGAIDMATTELTDGSNAEVKALAQQIIDTQQAEIDEMKALLGQS